MKRKQCKKRTLTLLEIMIVIFLITLITGVIGYNMKGSLEKGKKFRTEQACAQLEDMLHLALSEGCGTVEEIKKEPLEVLKRLAIAKNPEKLLKDGWGNKFDIHVNLKTKEVSVSSSSLTKKQSSSVANTDED